MRYMHIWISCLMVFSMATAGHAQRNISIDDTLAKHAEIFDLNMGHVFMNKWKKFKFGEYTVDTYKSGLSKDREHKNFFGTKVENTTFHRSSFVMRNAVNDNASVLMLYNSMSKTESNMVLGVIEFGEHEIMDSEYLTTTITINNDSSDIWTLYIARVSGRKTEDKNEAFLTNGIRYIQLVNVADKTNGFSRLGLPALGFKFYENEQPLAALQYFNGEFEKPQNTVWLDKRLDPHTKLILAASITAILKHAERDL